MFSEPKIQTPHLLGSCGEDIAENFLRKRGYRIISRGYRAGRGEIDIIAMDGRILVFIEVKTRKSAKYGLPEEHVSYKKKSQIRKTAARFLLSKNFPHSSCRFDIIGILCEEGKKPALSHHINAFE